MVACAYSHCGYLQLHSGSQFKLHEIADHKSRGSRAWREADGRFSVLSAGAPTEIAVTSRAQSAAHLLKYQSTNSIAKTIACEDRIDVSRCLVYSHHTSRHKDP